MSSASLFSKLPQLSDFIFLSLSLAAMEPHEAPLQQQQQAPNLPPPRLIISEMVLENFKSYAGEQRVGPFHKVCVFSLNAFACLLLKKKKKKRFRNLARGMRQATRVLLVDRPHQRVEFETLDAPVGSF